MITSLTIENFKAHRRTTIGLGRLTVLVGPNGTGKTSILQALRCMSQLVVKPARVVFSDDSKPSLLRRKGSTGPVLVQAGGLFAEREWRTSFALTVTDPDAGGDGGWGIRAEWLTPDGFSGADSANVLTLGAGERSPFWASLGSANVLRVAPRRVAAPSYTEQERPRVAHDGSNTASVLAALKLSDDERFDAVTSGLRRLVPALRRIRIRPARVQRALDQEVMGHQIVFDFDDAADVSAQAASDGTLMSLALLTVLHSENRPDLVLIDDIEQGLHPVAQIELMKQLAGLLGSFPDLQIVATTHSPFILDGVASEQVLVFFRRDDGEIVTKPLSLHPDAERAKGALSAGQIWTLDPESWVAEEGASA